MKKTLIFTLLVLGAVSCNKEQNLPESAPVSEKALTATFAESETKTAFVGGTYMWKQNDNMVVRSNNANGFTVYKYTGEDTAGPAAFNPNTEGDVITYGNNSFAIYPAKTSGTGAAAYPKEEDGSLKLVLKDTYTWFEGNVEAPMLAKVTSSATPLEFKQLGGVLKLTYKNVPPKATKVVVTAPVTDAALLAEGKNTYKICQTMSKTYNWTTAEGGFGSETLYVQAYAHTGNYSVTVNIKNATAAQRASDDGITVYVPLPVGPEMDGTAHVYPQLNVKMTFDDGTPVPGSEKNATNVQIERAHIKPMPAIVLTKYSVETIISGLTRTPHNMARITDNLFVVTGEPYHVFFLDVVNKTATQSAVNSASKYPQYPYGVCSVGNNLWIANKVGATGNGIYKYDRTTEIYSIVSTGFNQAMQIQEHNGSIYVLGRGDGSAAGKIHVHTGGVPGEVDPEVFADFSKVTASTGKVWPLSFAFDTDGSMVVAVSASSGSPTECFKLYRVASKGATPEPIFGSGTKAANYAALADGKSSSAAFSANMLQMQFDGSGNLYIADTYAVRKLVRGATGLEDGTLMTITESGALTSVDGLVFDSTYSHLYLVNKSTKSIYKITIE